MMTRSYGVETPQVYYSVFNRPSYLEIEVCIGIRFKELHELELLPVLNEVSIVHIHNDSC